MTKILITGGAGFIGTHLVNTYLVAGFQVAVLDKKEKKEVKLDLANIDYFQVDLTEEKAVEKIFAQFKPQIVSHHAALINVATSMQQTLDYENNNVLVTFKLLELCKKYQIKQFIFPSSVAVYGSKLKNGKTYSYPISEEIEGNPESFYGLQKYVCEKIISLYQNNFTTTIFRYANVFGPFQDSGAEGGVVAIFSENLAKNKNSIIYGDGKQTRDFIYVKDVVQANLLATQKNLAGIFNVSSQKEVSVNDLYFLLVKLNSHNMNPQYLSKRPGDIERSLLDNKKIKLNLGWQPLYSLKKGLKETLAYFQNLK
ncbi:SDR family NAD(P)-dependent oxidoreductase [Candidatus Beckwithbacteria bacterium]|nr:SDR family NAD(P)-dependent oxidoreductase [Candidatus Beckwithbacteria bacterium]